MKIVVALVFIGIIAALVSAGVQMLRSGRSDDATKRGRMARALAIRVALSVALFIFILISYQLGWIEPTGVPVGR